MVVASKLDLLVGI